MLRMQTNTIQAFTKKDRDHQSEMSTWQFHLRLKLNASGLGNPAGVTADLRAASEIRMSKRCLAPNLTKKKERKPLPLYISLCADPKGGPERLIYKPALCR